MAHRLLNTPDDEPIELTMTDQKTEAVPAHQAAPQTTVAPQAVIHALQQQIADLSLALALANARIAELTA